MDELFESRLSKSAREALESEVQSIFDNSFEYGYGGARSFSSYNAKEGIVDLIEAKMLEVLRDFERAVSPVPPRL